MVPLFLASVSAFAGKNVTALGMALKFRKDGLRVGFFKPMGPLPTRAEGVLTDEDAVFFKKALSLGEALDDLCPVVLTEETMGRVMRGAYPNARAQILAAFERVSKDKDVVIITGMGRLSSGLFLGYPASEFIKDVGAKVVITEKFKYPIEALDGIVYVKSILQDDLVGVVFNRIAPTVRTRIENSVSPFLRSRNIEMLGIIQEDPLLAAVPLSEVVSALNGRVLCGQNIEDVLIEQFSIGAMNVDAALRFFQRTPNKAVITGGDRADIQLAALDTSTRCLILTGDLYPNERILAHAEERGVPVVLVAADTLTTVETCENLGGHLSLHSERKLSRVAELVEQSVDFALVYDKLGLKRGNTGWPPTRT